MNILFLPRQSVDIEKANKQHRLPHKASSRVTDVISPTTFLPIFPGFYHWRISAKYYSYPDIQT